MHQVDDTIVAIASAPGGSLRGIVRVSGPETIGTVDTCFEAAQSLFEVSATQRIEGHLTVGKPLGKLPCAAYVWPSQRSYTRQPTIELHAIGSPPILQAIVRVLCSAGARLAQPGEFTMRAFLAGRLDLTQAEAVLGVIDAISQRDLDVALAQLAGGLAAPLHELRERLINMLAHLEAGLDFVEEDIEFISQRDLVDGIDEAASVLLAVQQQMQTRGETNDVPRVVLVGCPNAGKSSLLNALLNDQAAIVSDISGTTRDYVERRVRFGDQDVLLVDTAGVEVAEQATGIPSKAQAVTAQEQQKARLTLLCLDASRPLNSWEADELRRSAVSRRIVVATKHDVAGVASVGRELFPVHAETDKSARLTDRSSFTACQGDGVLATSSITGYGLSELRQAILHALSDDSSSAVTSTALRCHESLRLAKSSLDQARVAASEGLGEELVAAELRVVLEELGSVVGTVYTDDILDRIFSRFCIGK